MPVTTHTLTGDFGALIGEVQAIRATITTNSTDGAWVNETDDEIRLGGAALTLNEAGEFSVTLPTSTGTGLQYQVSADYVDADKKRRKWDSGWFTLTANADLADRAADSSLRVNNSQATILGGQIADLDTRVDAIEAGGGLTAITDRLDGVNDHGDVSGTLLLNPAKGFHVFDATGPTTVELGNPPGRSIAFQAITGADDVTVEGLDDLELTDGAWASFVYFRDAWHLASAGASGGGSVEPVTDPPTQPGTVTVDPTVNGYNLTWVASTVAAGYEGQVDGGAWSDYGAGTSEVLTGYSPGTSHSGAIRAYNSLGQKSTSRAWGPASVDTVGLHEQILALDPDSYLRTSRGSLEQFGDITWTFQNGTPSFAGPALVAGETGSVLVGGNGAHPHLFTNGAAAALDGVTDITVVAVVQALTGLSKIFDVPGLASFGASANSVQDYSNEYARYGNTHLWAVTLGPNATAGQQWRDGVVVNIDGQPFNSGNNTVGGVVRIAENAFGTGGGFYLSHIAVFANKVLTSSQLAALTSAAGTTGNPA